MLSSNFRHIQPTAVLGGIVDVQFVHDSSRFLWRKRLIERGAGVGIQVVHHQGDTLGARVELIRQMAYLMRPIDSRALVCHRNMALAR